MRIFPKYKLFQFDLALRYLRIGIQYSKKFEKKRNSNLWLQLLLQSDRICYRDRYAREDFDAVIIGADPVLGLLAARKLAKDNKRVLIYPDVQAGMPEEYYQLCNKRYSMYNQGFVRLSGLSERCFDVSEFVRSISNEISTLKTDSGEPLVVLAEQSCVIQTGSSGKKQHEFWLEFDAKRGLSELSPLWDTARSVNHSFGVLSKDIGWLKRHGKTSPKCLLQAKKMVATSYLSDSFPTNFTCPVLKISEAGKTILSFDEFTINDRIVDIVELAKVD